jgi:hypothetical protein
VLNVSLLYIKLMTLIHLMFVQFFEIMGENERERERLYYHPQVRLTSAGSSDERDWCPPALFSRPSPRSLLSLLVEIMTRYETAGKDRQCWLDVIMLLGGDLIWNDDDGREVEDRRSR